MRPEQRRIYHAVRAILDDLESAAPWAKLYHPPQDNHGFLAMESAFLDVVDRIPERVQALAAELREGEPDDAIEDLVSDAEFFFEGIHGNVASEIARLRAKVRALEATVDTIALTSEERALACELTADVKGKYTSSIMGAAASLIAEGFWDGVEIEPVLFPEKAEEFERNELLVEVLSEVIENISRLLDEVPLADFVRQWERGQRVDAYALTPLYSFLGNLGKLMKDKCRRALYSGDYHQVRKRERLLTVRIGELTKLHDRTWASDAEAVSGVGSEEIFEKMILRATELAAILDLSILKKILGEKQVKDLLMVVTLEKERARQEGGENGGLVAPEASPSLRKSLPTELHSLVPLLYDDDLQNYLGLLFGAVLKRASLALRHRQERVPTLRPAAPAPPVDLAGSSSGPAEASAMSPQVPPGPMPSAGLETTILPPSVMRAFDLGSAGAMPEREEPEIREPGEEPEIDLPGVEEPEIEEPGEGPEIDLPGVEEPEIEEPEKEPEIDLPGVEEPEIEEPEDEPAELAAAVEELTELRLDESLFTLPGEEALEPSPTSERAAPVAVEEKPAEEPSPVAPSTGVRQGATLEAPSAQASPAPVVPTNDVAALEELADLLEQLTSRDNAHRKSFELIHRLLKQGRTLPPSMLHSMHPYLHDLMNSLIPRLNDLEQVPDISPQNAARLFEYCTFLCDRNFALDQLRGQVPATMDRVFRLLSALQATTGSLLRELESRAVN